MAAGRVLIIMSALEASAAVTDEIRMKLVRLEG
jgi:hypothetical protein